MQGVIEKKSKIKAALVAPEVSSNIIPMSLILLAKPKEPESMGTTVARTRKLPPSIAPPPFLR